MYISLQMIMPTVRPECVRLSETVRYNGVCRDNQTALVPVNDGKLGLGQGSNLNARGEVGSGRVAVKPMPR